MRDDDGSVPRAHARAVRQQDVPVLHERVGRERDRRHIEARLQRPLVQRLDVLGDELELESAVVDRALREGPEHERVVGVRAVADADLHEAGDASSAA